MPLTPMGKGDFRLLPQFSEGDFPGYELYLSEFNEQTPASIEALPPHLKIISIHQPPSVRVNGQLFRSNLLDKGKIGEATIFSMKKIVELCRQRKIPMVVVHGAYYDSRKMTRAEAFSLLGNRLKSLERLSPQRLSHPEVELLCETDALWGPNYYSVRPLLCTEDDFLLLQAVTDKPIKITLDIEHFLITHYFTRFLRFRHFEDTDLYGGPESGEIEEKREFLQRDFLAFLAPRESALKQDLYNSLQQFIRSCGDNIMMIHLNGSDYHHFVFDAEKKLPLIGEHLPLGFDQDGVKDALDYNLLVAALRNLPPDKDIPVILEVWRKDPRAFIEEMRRSKQFLINYLNKSS